MKFYKTYLAGFVITQDDIQTYGLRGVRYAAKDDGRHYRGPDYRVINVEYFFKSKFDALDYRKILMELGAAPDRVNVYEFTLDRLNLGTAVRFLNGRVVAEKVERIAGKG